jgi:hypothetical protein
MPEKKVKAAFVEPMLLGRRREQIFASMASI